MNALYQASSEFVDFVPKTAKDAVLLFHRTTKTWSIAQWDCVPELLIKCARGLDPNGPEIELFEQWIMAPSMKLDEPNAPMPEHIDPKSCFPDKK